MYQGWFCLGGTEIINNMRAVGYAESASQLTNYLAEPKPGRPDRLVATNLFTNPSFEAASGTVEVRRNYQKYPGSGDSGFTGWGGYRTSVTNPGGYTRGTVTEAAGEFATGLTAPIATVYFVPVAPGEQVSLSTEIRGTKGVCIGLQYYDASGTIVGGSQQYGTRVPAGSWQVSTLSVTIPAGVAYIRPVNFITEAAVIGDTIDIRKWTAEKTSVPMGAPFDGNSRPTVRRNLAVNPRVTAAGTGWSSNNGALYVIQRGAPVPEPHPLGIETSVMCSSTGTNEVLASLYNVDGLGIGGSPQRMLGVWVYVNEPGYRMRAGAGGVTWPTDELPINTWVYMKTTSPAAAGGFATVYIEKISGSASTTARAWVTGLQVEAGATPVGDYMDGDIGAPRGFVTAWDGTPLVSASQMFDDDFTVAWLGGQNSSESILVGASVPGLLGRSGCVAISSRHWSESGQRSLRIIPNRSTTNINYVTIALPVPLGNPGTILVTRRQEATLTGPLWLSSRAPYVLNPQQASQDLAPNQAGETDQRLNYLPLSGSNVLVLPHGGITGSGDVWYDNLGIFQGEYDGPYFDGSSPPAGDGYATYWDGLPDQATSSLVAVGYPDEWPTYCDVKWFIENDECPGLYGALNETWLPQPPPPDGPYVWEAANIIPDAPWASTSTYESAGKFMGVYALDVQELSDSTRGLSVVEGISDGGTLGRSRLAVPRFRFRVMLTALDMDGLEYGTAWLSRALAEQACGSHGPSCGSTDLTFFASCPPPYEVFFGSEGASDPNAAYDLLLRTYHDVKCVAGPVVVEDIVGRAPNSYGRILEFDLAAGVPNLFGKVGLQYGEIDATFATIITDVPRNSIAVPSAEVASSSAEWLGATSRGDAGTQITVPTHISPAGGQTTHPSVLDFGADGFSGYRYWMAHTPYPAGSDAAEDPNIAASNDGSTWVVPAGLTNPLDDQPGSPGAYNSDVELVRRPSGGLLLMWRTYNPATTGGEEQFWVRTSADGITWTPKTLAHQSAASVRRLMSPTLVWENGGWTMWAVDILPSPNRLVRLRSEGETMTPAGWSTPVNCAVTMPSGRDIWHIQVRLLDEGYVGLLNDATLDASGLAGDIYVVTSSDGATWARGSSVAIPRTGGTGVGHQQLYRASFVRKSASQLDVWFAGWNSGPPIVWNMFRTTLNAVFNGGVIVATNYSTNPSVETNATGWSSSQDGTNITPAMLSAGRVTGELSAVGTAAYRVVFTATGAGSNGAFYAQQEVNLSSRPAGARTSINFWAAEALMAGSPVRPDIEIIAYWRATAGGAVLRTDNLGTVPVNGGALSVKSLVPPAGANFVLVRAAARLTSWPAGTIVRLYADALAVTVP